MRHVGWVAVISIAVFVQHVDGFSSARAEGRTSTKKPPVASDLSPHWNHNGSVVSLVSQGSKQKFFYDTPRVGLLDAGVKPGTLLFEGQSKGQNFEGTAYQFYRTCKPHGFPVTGNTSDDRKTITLKGKAPQLDMNCNVTGSRDDILVFTANLVAPNEPPKDTPVASATGTKVVAQAPSVVSEAKKPAPTTVATTPAVPSTPPEASRVNEKTALEGSNLKSGSATAATSAPVVATTAAPSETSKDKQGATTPEAVPSSAPVETAKEHAKQPAATQTALNASNSSATASTTTPSGEPAKANQTATAPAVSAATAKPDVAATVTSSTEKSVSAPASEQPKETQVASIPAGSAAKAADKPVEKPAEKPVDASKSKNTATAAVASVPASLPDKSKPDAAKAESDKVPTLVEYKAVPSGPPEKMMEIVLKNGRVLRIGRDIELEALARIIAQLER